MSGANTGRSRDYQLRRANVLADKCVAKCNDLVKEVNRFEQKVEEALVAHKGETAEAYAFLFNRTAIIHLALFSPDRRERRWAREELEFIGPGRMNRALLKTLRDAAKAPELPPRSRFRAFLLRFLPKRWR